MPDAVKTPEADELKKRQRELVDKLLAEAPVASSGTAVFGKTRADYTISASFIPVVPSSLDKDGDAPQAAVFTFAYLLKDAPATRPVCFAFNGGPGSSSVWLHLGALGPKRMRIGEDGSMPPPPYALEDNPDTWFEHFDLVFIDPPHTGYSQSASEDARKKHFSVDGDIAALADVVRGWLHRHNRWSSPLYLAGESYGTTRGAGIADKLQENGIALAGLILVSCAMDLQTLVFAPRNDLPYALFLPAFACVAQYHGRLKGAVGRSANAARKAAQAFVEDDYLSALHRGSSLIGEARRRVVNRLSELTGLSTAFVDEKNLRIADHDFFFELLRDEGKIVGRLDARVTGPMAASRSRAWEFDPAMEALTPPYTMAAQAYFRSLGMPAERRYDVFGEGVNQAWVWNRNAGPEPAKGNQYATTSTDLARALRRNPHLKVLVASGYYDLGTPYSATNWSLAQLDAPADVLTRITHHCYDGGHMMYTRSVDMRKMKADLASWLTR